ncbi:MAG: hypothetical protein PHF37_10735, partial [Phycisphaerae bacterium]|nr:hypothetical protein [Phycisphaerae bacterium]
MNLREIYCQDNAISLLQRAYSSARVPHAYVFAGRDGIGKLTTAKAWAKMLLCEETGDRVEGLVDSCGECKSCKLFESDSHPDFNLIYKELREFTKDGKGKAAPVEMPIDVIREFLIEKVSNRPTESARRVFIVTEAEKLNPASQNALLKVLEEPPAYCSIILICTR